MKYVEDHWELDGHNRILAIAYGLSPILLFGVLYVTSSNCCHSLSEPVAAGISPVVLAIAVLASALALVGTIVIWRARSARAVLRAVLLLTLPALVLILFAPAIVLIFGNLAATPGP